MTTFRTMMLSTAAAIAALLLAVPALAQTDEAAVRQQVAKIAGLDGADYLAGRQAVTALGAGALPGLEALADSTADWRVAAAADACAGWIADGEIYEAFEAIGTGVTRGNTVQYRRGDVAWDTTLTPLLVEKLLWTEADGDLRAAAVDLLGRIHDPRSAEALAWSLNHDPDVMVQLLAATALRRIDDVAAHDGLVQALRQSEDPNIRAAAAMSLGWRKHPAASAALLDALGRDGAVDVRAASAKALGWIGDPSADIALETALTGDPEALVRRQAALALGRLGTDRARSALEHARASDTDTEVVRLAGVALDKF